MIQPVVPPPTELQFWDYVQFGILGVVFFMVVFRKGLMTTQAHSEVVELYKDALKAERERGDKAEESAQLAIETSRVANKGLEASNNALEALREIAIRQRYSPEGGPP